MRVYLHKRMRIWFAYFTLLTENKPFTYVDNNMHNLSSRYVNVCIYICVCDFVYIYQSEVWFVVLIRVYIFVLVYYMIVN